MDNWIFKVIEEYPCENKIQLRQEQYHYDLLNPALNMIRPYISEQERKAYHNKRSAKHYKDNIEECKKRQANYYKDNKEKINQKFICECGKEYTHQNKKRHCDSKIHKNFLAK
jgi:predicted metallo-beta-lactamase superfamily hydrolase